MEVTDTPASSDRGLDVRLQARQNPPDARIAVPETIWGAHAGVPHLDPRSWISGADDRVVLDRRSKKKKL